MHEGRIAQVGSPREIYEQPKNRFVTEFIGESNILPCEVVAYDKDVAQIEVGGITLFSSAAYDVSTGDKCVFALRPEALLVNIKEDATDWNCLKLTVNSVIYQGALVRFEFDLRSNSLIAEVPNHHITPTTSTGDELFVSWKVTAGRILTD